MTDTKYLVTAIIQNQAELGLFKTHINFPEIEHAGHVKELYSLAQRVVETRLKLYTGITQTYQITVWKKNIFGGWCPVERSA